MDAEKQEAVANFMAITSAEADVAMGMLEASDFNLETAVNLFFTAGPAATEGAAGGAPAAMEGIETDEEVARRLQNEANQAPPPAEEDVRAADAIRTERLYDDGHLHHMQRAASNMEVPPQAMDAFRNFESEVAAASDAGAAGQGLADLFKPPSDIMFAGGFDQAKDAASLAGKWLVVNIQSNEEFASHQLNRDTWADENVKTMIKTFFVFWQTYNISDAGQRVCGFYKLHDFPVVLLVDPVTGACMSQWHGYLKPAELIDKLDPFMDASPEDGVKVQSLLRKQQSRGASSTQAGASSQNQPMTEDEEMALAMQMSIQAAEAAASGPNEPALDTEEAPSALEPTVSADEVAAKALSSLPDEPDPSDTNSARVAIRLPNGQRVQRRFPKSSAVQALYDFCVVSVREAAEGRQFSIKPSFPGAQELMDVDQDLAQAGVAGAMLVMSWKD